MFGKWVGIFFAGWWDIKVVNPNSVKNCFLIKNFFPHKDILRTQVTTALIQKVGGLLCVGSEKVIALVLQYLG